MLVGGKTIPVPVTGWLYIGVAILCVFKAINGDVEGFFCTLPYAIFTEVFVRGFARWVPYLTLQYLFIICFPILILRGSKLRTPHFKGFFLLVLFCAMEILNNLYPDRPISVRSIVVNSFALLGAVAWASYNNMKPVFINKVLNNVKIAFIYLTGIVFVAHLTGKINYGLYSSSEASNGLAPVQLSGYLGTGCILLFLSIMNPEDSKHKLINVLILAFCATVMVLTFSRGGLYFIGVVVALYLFYNRAKLGQYFQVIFLVPIAFFIYSYVVNQTGGKIVDRYEQEGTSNRDELVRIGFKIFADNPVIGVGTSNFNTTIKKEKLFSEESGAHNEFVRAAAEHGILGLIFYWGFYISLIVTILRRRQPQKQYAMYFFALFCLIMVHNGLKISLQPIIILFAIATPTPLLKKPNRFVTKELAEPRLA